MIHHPLSICHLTVLISIFAPHRVKTSVSYFPSLEPVHWKAEEAGLTRWSCLTRQDIAKTQTRNHGNVATLLWECGLVMTCEDIVVGAKSKPLTLFPRAGPGLG